MKMIDFPFSLCNEQGLNTTVGERYSQLSTVYVPSCFVVHAINTHGGKNILHTHIHTDGSHFQLLTFNDERERVGLSTDSDN